MAKMSGLVTVMKNGLKVASEQRHGPFSLAGIAISSGSRFETSYPKGVSHFVEKTAFKSTQKFNSRDDILQHLSGLGGTFDCQGSRDLLVYAVSVLNRHLESAVELLGEAVLRPRFTSDELNETSNRISFELQDIQLDPERKVMLNEMIHRAAYGCQALGLPKTCPIDNVNKISPGTIYNYLKHTHTPDRMVLAAVGVDHDRLVEFAQKFFVDKQPIWEEEPQLASDEPSQVEHAKSDYVGGMLAVEADLSNVSLALSPLPNLVHFQLGFEASSHRDLDDFVTTCVLNMLMGGGGSFSAGGPGKGMYTRLFTNVLNRHYWINSCVAQNLSYEDTGLFFIQSSSEPSQLKDLVDIVIHQFNSIVNGPMTREELARAKKQLISMLWLNLELRPVLFEDVARQVLSSGFRREPKLLIEKIEKVTEEDIKRIAKNMLSKRPTVACLGDVSRLPSYDYIQSRIQV